MKKQLVRFFADDSGATAIEYGLIAALISAICIGAWTTIGTELKDMYTGIGTSINGAVTAGTP